VKVAYFFGGHPVQPNNFNFVSKNLFATLTSYRLPLSLYPVIKL